MIEVNFKEHEDGHIELTVKGHAMYDQPGKDIVCASASTLFYTLAKSLLEAKDKGMLDEMPVINDSDEADEKIIKCKPNEKFKGNISLMYWMVMNGFEGLVNIYPTYVKII